MKPPSLVSAHHFEGIGRVAVACARLEFEQSKLTGALVATDPTVVSALVNPGEPFSRLQQLARTLTVARFGTVRGATHPHPLAVELERWMTAARDLIERRNTYLHSLWGIGPDQQVGVITLRKPHQTMNVSLADLDALQREIDEHIDRSQPLVQRVVAEVRAREAVVHSVLDEAESTQ